MKVRRIILSNIQIHCCCCFELQIKMSYHYEEFHSSYDILSILFMVKYATSVKCNEIITRSYPNIRISPRYDILKHD